MTDDIKNLSLKKKRKIFLAKTQCCQNEEKIKKSESCAKNFDFDKRNVNRKDDFKAFGDRHRRELLMKVAWF